MKHPVIKQIEKIVGAELHPAPDRNGDRTAALMPFKRNFPKYVMDADEQTLIGLNLARTGLTDEQWQRILALDVVAEHLQLLNLSDNQLTVFPFPSGLGLRKLKSLNLEGNQLKEFLLPNGMTALEEINLEGNPLETPPEEIIRQGKAAVLQYLQELVTYGVKEIFEVKMLIVGEGGTGKTTLWNLLQNEDHPVPDQKQESTIGIQIKEGWTFEHPDRPGEDFLVNLWDFGGQEIQYMTHQFFLTRRSFYVLLADGRKEVANFSYWFKIISLLGCDENDNDQLPVLVVLNEKGNPIAKPPYDPATVQKDFPKLKVIKREVDFGKKDGRFEALTLAIQEILTKEIPHLPLEYPENWSNVRKALYQLRESKNYISSTEFKQICADKQVEDLKSQQTLSQLLHDLGIILHFNEDPALADFIVLNPKWAANAVYEVMRHGEVKENLGRFDKELLRKVWTELEYSDFEQSRLLNLMLKDNFEVCFRATEKGREIYIAPQLLPPQQPENFEWTPDQSTLQYIYQYPFMPKGIIGRLIVRLNEDIETREGLKMVWEKGAILEKAEEQWRALLVEDRDPNDGRKLIRIAVQGQHADDRKNVLRDIRKELNGIHKRSFPTLKVFQKIPCNCSECKNKIKPFEHDFDNLKRLKRKEIKFSQCSESGESVPIRQLLEGVFDRSEVASVTEGQTIVNIKNEIVMPENKDQQQTALDASSIYSYLSAVIIIGGFILILLNMVPTLKAIVGIVAMVLLLTIVGALQLMNDQRVTQKNFLVLMGMVFKKIPPLNLILKSKPAPEAGE